MVSATEYDASRPARQRLRVHRTSWARVYPRTRERLRLIELATADPVAAALHIEIEGTVARRQPPASTTTSALRRLRAVLGFAQLPSARA